MSINTLRYCNQLQAENEQLKRKLQKLENDLELSSETLKNANEVVLAAMAKFDQFCVDNDALKEQVRVLTAENAAIKKIAGKLVASYIMNKGTESEFISCITPSKSSIGSGGVWDDWHNLSSAIDSTPATDNFIAEVRNEAGAIAVELFARTLGSPYTFRDEKCYEDGFTRAIEIVRDIQAPRFSARLRKGART